MYLNYPHIPNSQLDTKVLTRSAFWSLLSPCSDRCVTLAPGTDATPGTRATSPNTYGAALADGADTGRRAPPGERLLAHALCCALGSWAAPCCPAH